MKKKRPGITAARFICTIFLALSCLLCSGCNAVSKEETPVTRALFAMDTYMTLSAYGEHTSDALDAAEDEINRLDSLLSTGIETSEISVLNRDGHLIFSDITAYILERALEVNRITEGAYNPLVYPLMRLWGFPSGDYRVPSQEEIDQLLPAADLSGMIYDPETKEVSFQIPGMAVDFGGIAKGYTSAHITDILQDQGIQHAVISLGGNVQTLGCKPDGSKWKVAVADPLNKESYLGILETNDQAVITSGGYERYFEADGKTYHHILDPATGYPADSGLLSVTIVSDDGTLADGLSTGLFVLGLDQAVETWRRNSPLFQAIFFTEGKELYITEGIADAFLSPAYPVHIVNE